MKNLLLIWCVLWFNSIAGLTASFNSTTVSGCAPLVVDFTDASTGAPTSWSYNFGDGGTSTAQNPRYVFTKSGRFTVTLTVSDGVSTSSATLLIVVRKLPTPDFTVSKTEYCPGDQVNFLNATTKGDTSISTSSWDFGDGNVSNGNGNVSKTYNTQGSYTIKLTVRDHFNCANTITKTNYIVVHPKPNPVFGMNAKYSCAAPQRVNLSNNSSNSVSFLWDLGDGTTSTQASPIVFYNDPKTYIIKLTATSDKGCIASSSQNVIVQFGKIKADFTADDFKGCIPFNPKLKNASQPVGAKLDYSWDFGDGTKSTLENPTKTFIRTGSYNIKLIANGNGAGCTDTVVKTILLSDKPQAVLSQSDTLACDGKLSSLFKAKTSNDIEKFVWFIDGKNIDTKVDSLRYEFKTTGIYNVVVLLSDKAGCQQTFAFKPVVVQHLAGGFRANSEGGCIPYRHFVYDTTISLLPSTYTYTWDDGQGNSSTAQNPSFFYKDTGKYEIKQYVRDNYGCLFEAWSIIQTGERMTPNFKMDKTKICNNELIKMENTTPDSIFKQVDNWIWVFGNETGYDPLSFSTSIRDYPKTYSPMLVSINNMCRDTLMKMDSVTILPTLADFIVTFDTCFSTTGKLRHSSVLATEHTWFLPGNKTSKDSILYFKFKPGVKETFMVAAYNKHTGCADTIEQDISPPASASNVVAGKVNLCTPQTFKLENFMATSYRDHWDMGNGDTAANKDSFRYTYFVPGKYKIKHTGWDIRGCPYSSDIVVDVDGPTAKAEIWPKRGCLPLNIKLVDSVSTGKVKRKYWKFEDDPQWRKATNKNEVIDYTINSMPKSGDTLFRIELFVEDSGGCQTTQVYTVRPSGPKAGIQVTPDMRCDGIEYAFEANLDSSSASYPVDITWDMGDGQILKTDRFNYIYEKGGRYKIKVKLQDGLGCSLNEEMNLVAQDPDLLAKFKANNQTAVCPPLIVNFTEESITDPARPAVSFLWNFGDGTTSTLRNPSKIYTNPGKYDVSLTVTNLQGCSNTSTYKSYITIGGPTAIYNFDPKAGCWPLKANFKATTTPNTRMEWDFGDGYTNPNPNCSYEYERPGTYFPKILLTDQGGCSVVLLPKDSIVVKPGPEANFSFNSQCLDDSILFSNLSGSGIVGQNQFFSRWVIDKDTIDQRHLKYKFKQNGQVKVSLTIQNTDNCVDTSSHILRISKPKSRFSILSGKLCLGDSVRVRDESLSLNGKKELRWLIDKQISSLPLRPDKGERTLSQIIIDTLNCSDTFVSPLRIHVGDTAPPDLIAIERVSHISDRSVEIKFKVSQDIDFDYYSLLTFENGNWTTIRSTKDKSVDQFNYNLNGPKESECFIIRQTNYCKAESPLSGEHCSIHLETLASESSNILNWNTYTGWPVDFYEIERENEDGNFILIGTTDGNTTSFKDTMVTCKRLHAYRIKAIGTSYSYSDTSKSKAKWENKLPVQKYLHATVVADTSVRLSWEKTTGYNRSQLTAYVLYRYDVNGFQQFTIHKDSISFLDKRLHVDINRYSYYLRQTDDCGDSSQFSNLAGNIRVSQYKTDVFDPPGISWNAYRNWSQGVKQYLVQRQTADGSFETIAITSDTFFIDAGTQNSCIKNYVYRVVAELNGTDETISLSNYLRIKPVSTLHIPNAFTPNGNQLNEVFGAKGQYIYDYHLEIYNRWGERVYETSDCMGTWDGTFNGEPAEQNVYFYRISARGTDGKLYIQSGTVTLLK